MDRRGRRLDCVQSSVAIFCVLLMALAFPPGVTGETTTGDQPFSLELEGVLSTIGTCMTQSPAPWPQAWQQEYTDTILKTAIPYRNDPRYAERLRILRDGFGPFWERLSNHPNRTQFEMRRAQIRWYVEHLMTRELPDEQERQTIRRQYADLADRATQSLLAQFPFLDPNIVQKAKADYLADCSRNIDAPLLPIFLSPLSETQTSRIEQSWHGLRYARIDLWRQLSAVPRTSPEDRPAAPAQTHPGYLLTQHSLIQLQSQVWPIVAPAPDYCLAAATADVDAMKRNMQLAAEARSRELQLKPAVRQTECLAFLLASLLETPACFEPDIGEKTLENLDGCATKGGD